MELKELLSVFLILIIGKSSGKPDGIRELLATRNLDLTAVSFAPEVHMNFCEIVDYYGYKCEEYLHDVVTDDGFLLTMHRITGRKGQPSNFTKPPIFIQHGLLCDSTSWILNTPKDSLPFMLSDAGYDVWLGNSRGNTYSRAHQTLKEDSDAFWAWSWEEMAMYDLPASIDFVLGHTGYERFYYIGHSQGILSALVHLSTTQTDKIIYMVALGPVFQLAHMKGLFTEIAPFAKDLYLAFEFFGMRDFLPNNWLIKLLVQRMCAKVDPERKFCANILFLFGGYDANQLNESRLAVYTSHAPAGTSVRNMLHYAQMYNSKSTTRFDYGSKEANMKHYGTPTPPAYNLSAVTNVPVTLYAAGNDPFANPQDVAYLVAHLKTVRRAFYLPEWNHLDFIWAMDASKLIYDGIIKQLQLL